LFDGQFGVNDRPAFGLGRQGLCVRRKQKRQSEEKTPTEIRKRINACHYDIFVQMNDAE